jgi:hypothetical protein
MDSTYRTRVSCRTDLRFLSGSIRGVRSTDKGPLDPTFLFLIAAGSSGSSMEPWPPIGRSSPRTWAWLGSYRRPRGQDPLQVDACAGYAPLGCAGFSGAGSRRLDAMPKPPGKTASVSVGDAPKLGRGASRRKGNSWPQWDARATVRADKCRKCNGMHLEQSAKRGTATPVGNPAAEPPKPFSARSPPAGDLESGLSENDHRFRSSLSWA